MDHYKPITREDILKKASEAARMGIYTLKTHIEGNGKRIDVVEFVCLAEKAIYPLSFSYEDLRLSLYTFTGSAVTAFNEYWNAKSRYLKARIGRNGAISRKDALFPYINKIFVSQKEMAKSTEEMKAVLEEFNQFVETDMKNELATVRNPFS